MQTVVLIAGEHYPIPAEELFASFGCGTTGGWLLGATCDAVRPGATVSASIPLGSDSADVVLLGRISSCVPGSKITITHDQPWRGRIHLRFTNEPGGSRLRVSAELDDAGLAWWMEQRGWNTTAVADPGTHRVGLLTSKTGPGAIFAVTCEYLARLAVEQINADGGITGCRVELVIHDDATDSGRAALEARRMVQSGCRAIIASVTSASFEAVRRTVATAGLPLIHPVLNEGGRGEPNVFRWGERPFAQMRAAAPSLTREGTGPNWFHIGNDYSWSHGAHRAATQVIEEDGGSLLRYAFTPLGTTDFAPLIDKIRASDASRVLSSLVGADEVSFERQLWQSGLRERCSVLSLVLEDSTRERIGAPAANGIWTAFGYFNTLDSQSNHDLTRRYRDTYGRWAPPISSFSEAVYEAILLYASAARAEDDILRSLRRVTADLPRGHVSVNGPQVMRQRIHVGQAAGDGYHLAEQ
ncbi:substrate-binding protein [Nocardia jiangxiensis]|uniref:substrate-binding protein n=1 Tax=Nocardia jiangxiensis TaxID=282685 RepID=UPI0002E13AFD|nr:substrate-binding protein [Nocardia jiangxiensis]